MSTTVGAQDGTELVGDKSQAQGWLNMLETTSPNQLNSTECAPWMPLQEYHDYDISELCLKTFRFNAGAVRVGHFLLNAILLHDHDPHSH